MKTAYHSHPGIQAACEAAEGAGVPGPIISYIIALLLKYGPAIIAELPALLAMFGIPISPALLSLIQFLISIFAPQPPIPVPPLPVPAP